MTRRHATRILLITALGGYAATQSGCIVAGAHVAGKAVFGGKKRKKKRREKRQARKDRKREKRLAKKEAREESRARRAETKASRDLADADGRQQDPGH